MALSYVIDKARRLVVARAADTLTEADLQSWRTHVQGDPAFDRHYGQLLDLRAVTDVSVSVPALARMAATPVFKQGTRRAIVAETDLQYGFGHTYALLSEPHAQIMNVFREIELAEAWLIGRL